MMAIPRENMLWLFLAAAFWGGCASTPRSREVADSYLREVGVLVAHRYMGNNDPALLDEAEALQALRKQFWFRGGNSYGVAQMAKEITRVTGKRLVWLPEENEMLLRREEYRGGYLSFPSARTDSRGNLRKAELGRALAFFLGVLDQITRPPGEEGSASIWTAWLSPDAIFIIRLPRDRESRVASPPVENKPSRRTEEGYPGLFRTIVVVPLPLEWDTDAPRDPGSGLLSPEAFSDFLGQPLALKEGDCTYGDLVAGVARLTSRQIVWLPEVKRTPCRPLGLDELYTFPMHVRGSVDAAFILGYLLGVATETGLGYESPDREVWVALAVGARICFTSFPGLHEWE